MSMYASKLAWPILAACLSACGGFSGDEGARPTSESAAAGDGVGNGERADAHERADSPERAGAPEPEGAEPRGPQGRGAEVVEHPAGLRVAVPDELEASILYDEAEPPEPRREVMQISNTMDYCLLGKVNMGPEETFVSADERMEREREERAGCGAPEDAPFWEEIELVEATDDRQIVEGKSYTCYYSTYRWIMKAWYRTGEDHGVWAWISPGQAAGPNCDDPEVHERRRELAREALQGIEVETTR